MGTSPRGPLSCEDLLGRLLGLAELAGLPHLALDWSAPHVMTNTVADAVVDEAACVWLSGGSGTVTHFSNKATTSWSC